ncbi:MAG: helix-turn-helix transcriptional regulator [Chloroflexi bacterium]|nr:helix-turn-helix transcriptional regulator [Chloroflexota bacterium]
MDDVAIGRLVRVIRRRLGLRQADVAERAKVSQQLVSLLETGGLGRLSLGTARGIASTLGAELVVTVRWRGAELDRMRDEGHAAVVATIASILKAEGWLTAAEVTYSEYGERGSIDLLAFHPETRILLVVEAKTEVVSVEETLRRHDAKVRLAARIARQRFGWSSVATCPLLAITDTRTARRRIERHDGVFGRTYPVRGWAARAWLRKPAVGAGLLLFLTGTSQAGGRQGPVGSRRVRVARPAGREHDEPGPASRSRPGGRPSAD